MDVREFEFTFVLTRLAEQVEEESPFERVLKAMSTSEGAANNASTNTDTSSSSSSSSSSSRNVRVLPSPFANTAFTYDEFDEEPTDGSPSLSSLWRTSTSTTSSSGGENSSNIASSSINMDMLYVYLSQRLHVAKGDVSRITPRW